MCPKETRMSNLLINPSFDGATYQKDGIGELTIPEGWEPFWHQGTDKEVADGYWKRPEFKPEPYRVHEGKQGVKWFTTYATHDAGLLQIVNVTPGQALTLTAWCQYWSEHDDKSGGGYALTIGIDPYGKVEPFGESVIWAPWIGQDLGWKDGSTWQQLSLKVTAIADKITVYLRGACKWRARHNDAYLDDVVLEAAGSEPTPTPTPDDEWLKLLDTRLLSIESNLVTVKDQLAMVARHFSDYPED
jgi:hypothetical protein